MRKRGADDPSNDKIATDKLNRGGLIDPGPPLIFERSVLVEVPVEWGLANLAVVATVAMTWRNRCTTVGETLFLSLSPWKGTTSLRNPLFHNLSSHRCRPRVIARKTLPLPPPRVNAIIVHGFHFRSLENRVRSSRLEEIRDRS